MNYILLRFSEISEEYVLWGVYYYEREAIEAAKQCKFDSYMVIFGDIVKKV